MIALSLISITKNSTTHTRHFPNSHTNLFPIQLIPLTHKNMQSISLVNSSPIFHPISNSNGKKPNSFGPIIMASMRGSADQNFSGRLVDESMIILRKRIHEMNMIERNYEPPSDWMDWEKSYYTKYDSMICEAVGLLQTQLMNTRPSLALGAMALVAVSVPASSALAFFHLVELTKALLAGVHLG